MSSNRNRLGVRPAERHKPVGQPSLEGVERDQFPIGAILFQDRGSPAGQHERERLIQFGDSRVGASRPFPGPLCLALAAVLPLLGIPSGKLRIGLQARDEIVIALPGLVQRLRETERCTRARIVPAGLFVGFTLVSKTRSGFFDEPFYRRGLNPSQFRRSVRETFTTLPRNIDG